MPARSSTHTPIQRFRLTIRSNPPTTHVVALLHQCNIHRMPSTWRADHATRTTAHHHSNNVHDIKTHCTMTT
ncbi:hypothetical protein XF_0622 [Xylella fastidiosa 9a5c]|uniref:Uncharacterized protein n=1 Tax=Xylella fastidiosa (strain 9a5c) TaxID=160492 RepID=Q9PFN5_XYLFA|nr:hypothetical protein XF_0622 [Xylella fastidiosa 9a5c]